MIIPRCCLGRGSISPGNALSLPLVVVFLAMLAVFPASAQATGTTAVHVVKCASDGKTVIQESTVDYRWMEECLPVQGDGTTHYYHQGPTFEEDNPWDPSETVNLKDHGALKGTDIKDLCELVGGMRKGDTVRVRATDGFNCQFPYENVYHPLPQQGPLILCWWKDGEYVPSFAEGIKLIFFARTTNKDGQYVFGNRDMQQCFTEKYRHFFNQWPSSNGYTIRNVTEVMIFSAEAPATQGLVVAAIAFGAAAGLIAGAILRRKRRSQSGG